MELMLLGPRVLSSALFRIRCQTMPCAVQGQLALPVSSSCDNDSEKLFYPFGKITRLMYQQSRALKKACSGQKCACWVETIRILRPGPSVANVS